MTDQISALNDRMVALERSVAALRDTIEAQFAPPLAPKPVTPPAWAGTSNPNLGASYSGPPSEQGGGAISFGRPGVPIDGVKRDAEGRVIVNVPAPTPRGPDRTANHQRAVEIIDEMLPLKGA